MGWSRFSPKIASRYKSGQGQLEFGCRCRLDLISHIHSLDSGMQKTPQPRIDNMFKVTGKTIKGCSAALECLNCHIGPVDLVLILNIFQQTAYYFQQITQSSLNSDWFTAGIGDYQVLLNEDGSAIKSMLVLNLVAQASSLLDAISAHAQGLCLSSSSPDTGSMSRSPACSNQLNLEYVKQVMSRFKKLFRLIIDVSTMRTA